MSNIIKGRRARVKYEEPSPNGIAAVMKSVIYLCNDNNNCRSKGIATTVTNRLNNVVTIEHLHTSELYAMIEHHKLHMQSLKDNDILSEDKKMSIINKIENIFSIIEGRSVVKKRNAPSNNNSTTGHKVSK